MMKFQANYTTQDYIDMQIKRLALTDELNSYKKRATLIMLLTVLILSLTLNLFSSFPGAIVGILLIILTGVFVPPALEKTTIKSVRKQFEGKIWTMLLALSNLN
ncbi:hypothetical protein [Jeotgalibacillus malaysiensis]|uniref:hypothetical protein n=1 Tax=Jeotgalibacillus malaysiensis TaxID=1508404 RepID=UPI00384B4135